MNFRATALAILMSLACDAAETVFIDDTELAGQFEKSLTKLAEGGKLLTLDKAREAMDDRKDKKIPVPPFDRPAATPESLYDRCAPAVVAIGTVYQCRKCDKWHQDGFSTGWIASPDGLIVTSAHLFEGQSNDGLGVMTRDGRVFPVREILSADRDSDIAILRITPGAKKLPALPLARSSAPGDEVFVIGHPQGRLYCLTTGRISRFHRQHYKENTRPTDWMSITADFAGGSSGGPVLNSRGEVVGMVASTLTAYSEETGCKTHPDPDVQMVFKDCVPLSSLRAMFQQGE